MTSEIRTNTLTSRAGLSTVTMTDSGPMFSGIATFVDNSGFTFGVGSGSSIFTPATNVLTFGTNSNESLRINSTGQIITNGNTTPYPTRSATFQPPSGQTNCYVSIVAGNTSSTSGLTFGDSGAAAAGNYAGMIEYNHNTNGMKFYTNETEKLRIGTQGQIGLSGANYGTSGQVLTSQGSGSAATWTNISASSDKILEGDSKVEVTDSGTGRVDVVVDGAYGVRFLAQNNNRSYTIFGNNVATQNNYGSNDGNIIIANGGQRLRFFKQGVGMADDTVIGTIDFAAQQSGTGGQTVSLIQSSLRGSVENKSDLIFSTSNAGSPTEKLRILADGRVRIGSNDSAFGQLSLSMPTQSGGAALQVMNTAAGSGDGSLSNIVLRSVNSVGTQWAMAEYRAQYHMFSNQGTEVLRTQTSGDYGSVETRNSKNGFGGYSIQNGSNWVWMADTNTAGLYNDTDNQWLITGTKNGDTFLYSQGSQTLRSYVTGDYGTIQTMATKNGWGGYSIAGQFVFMANANSAGIYNDIDNEWMMYCNRNGGFHLFHDNALYLNSASGEIEIAQNIRLESKPNSTWGAGLYFGGNGHAASSTHGSMVVTNGNIHIDPRNGSYGTYLNWYSGSSGTYFGNAASGQAGHISSSGNMTISGGYSGSDLRLKENIKNITGATDIIKSLVGKTYTWKKGIGLDDWNHYGLVAQEVQKVAPDLVRDNGSQFFDKDDNLVKEFDPTESDEDRKNKGLNQSLTVNYEGVTPILVEAMKELITKVESLEQENIALRSRVTNLEGE